MPKPNKLFPTPPTPERVMQVLKDQLASSGYHIFGVAKRFRGTPSDFVAVKRDNASNLLLVKKMHSGVQAQPFATAGNTYPGYGVVQKMQYEGRRLVTWGKQIDLRRKNLYLVHFVPPAQRAELARLFPQLELAA